MKTAVRGKRGVCKGAVKRRKNISGRNRETWTGFDDCPICRAMRDGRADTLEGLTEAFREAKRSYPDRSFIVEDETP